MEAPYPLDAAYPTIIDEVAAAIRALTGGTVGRTTRPGCIELYSYWKRWPALFPQHGAGRKHERRIELDPWQGEIAQREGQALIRGLIHSDGSRYIATVRVRGRVYRYVRYAFSNRSEDIKAIFCDRLDALGTRWTRPNAKLIAIARRGEVAKLDAFVGPKR
jgi:hypothetical protein